MKFVEDFPDPKNLDAIGNVVFRNSTCSVDDGITKLKSSVDYFRRNSVPCSQLEERKGSFI